MLIIQYNQMSHYCPGYSRRKPHQLSIVITSTQLDNYCRRRHYRLPSTGLTKGQQSDPTTRKSKSAAEVSHRMRMGMGMGMGIQMGMEMEDYSEGY